MGYPPKIPALLLLPLAAAVVVTAQNSDQDMLDAHNVVRAVVGVELLAWDATVAAYADAYAKERAADCQLVLSPGSPYGENLFRGGPGIDWTALDAVIFWTSGKLYYDHDTNTCSAPPGQTCAEYTQVVWSNTTALGCARYVCDGGAGVFIMCSYSPPGNVAGQMPY